MLFDGRRRRKMTLLLLMLNSCRTQRGSVRSDRSWLLHLLCHSRACESSLHSSAQAHLYLLRGAVEALQVPGICCIVARAAPDLHSAQHSDKLGHASHVHKINTDST